MKTWLTRIAEAQNRPFVEVVQSEAISKYLDVKDDNKLVLQVFGDGQDILLRNVKPNQLHQRLPTMTDTCRVERYVHALFSKFAT